jgi:hypothetical protein
MCKEVRIGIYGLKDKLHYFTYYTFNCSLGRFKGKLGDKTNLEKISDRLADFFKKAKTSKLVLFDDKPERISSSFEHIMNGVYMYMLAWNLHQRGIPVETEYMGKTGRFN